MKNCIKGSQNYRMLKKKTLVQKNITNRTNILIYYQLKVAFDYVSQYGLDSPTMNANILERLTPESSL